MGPKRDFSLGSHEKENKVRARVPTTSQQRDAVFEKISAGVSNNRYLSQTPVRREITGLNAGVSAETNHGCVPFTSYRVRVL